MDPDRNAFDEALESMDPERRAFIRSLTEDSSYIEPRVVMHIPD